MKPKVQLVMICAKYMNVSEETVVGCSIIYNSGKWTDTLFRDDLEYRYNQYLEGYVCEIVEDFVLDMLSGRIPPNLLMNALTKLGDKAKTQKLERRKK